MPVELLRDFDIKFIGLNSRDNPASLPAGFVSKSQNFRFDRGIATVRKGLKRKTTSSIVGESNFFTEVLVDSGTFARIASILGEACSII